MGTGTVGYHEERVRCTEGGPILPRKIRQLKADLRRAGFLNRGGKGDHGNWEHPFLPYPVTLDGHDGDDAHPYQEKNVRAALADLRERKR